MKTSTTTLLQTALDHHRAGRLTDAEKIYREILNEQSDHPDALYFMGVLFSQSGKNKEAISFFEQVASLRPTAHIYLSLGDIFQRIGQHDQALEQYSRALKLNPSSFEVLNNRGNLLFNLKRYDEALADYDSALKINPRFAMAINNRGSVLRLLGRFSEALDCFQRATALQPDYAEAYYNYASTLNACGRFPEAILSYQKAIALNPAYAAAHNNLGTSLEASGRLEDAIAHFEKAIAINPHFFEAYNNLGNTFKDRGLLDEALLYYQKALEINPHYPDAYYNKGQVLHDQGHAPEALACYQKAIDLRDFYPEARWALAMASIPLLIEDPQDLKKYRMEFATQLEKLDHWFNEERTGLGFRAVGVSHPFYLAYQEEENRPLLEQYGSLCARLMQAWQTKNLLSSSTEAPPKGLLRLGIVSSHIHNHSVWHALIKGWLKHLNPALIDIHLFYVGHHQDEETIWAKNRAKSFHTISKNLDAAVRLIASHDLDVLIYPEIGMEPLTQKLASLRLCPVQIASWGHPETSGLPTIDYYMSAACFEPEDAADHYSESLIQLPNLGCCYEPLEVTSIPCDLTSLGLKSGGPLLISPGVPFKYAPQHDHVFVDIAKQVPSCQIVFFTHDRRELSDRLQRRLRSVFLKAGLDFEATCLFIPWLDKSAFYGLMRQADVFLDTIGFSGFNTAMQAIQCGLPLVTREGRFMRGRLASGILKRLELPELVADSSAAYIKQAVRLATDADYRHTIRSHIEKHRARLLEDKEPIKALEQWLIQHTQRLHPIEERSGV